MIDTNPTQLTRPEKPLPSSGVKILSAAELRAIYPSATSSENLLIDRYQSLETELISSRKEIDMLRECNESLVGSEQFIRNEKNRLAAEVNRLTRGIYESMGT